MRQQTPNMSSRMLVKVKALMALVTFWILRSLLGVVVTLIMDKGKGEIKNTWGCFHASGHGWSSYAPPDTGSQIHCHVSLHVPLLYA